MPFVAINAVTREQVVSLDYDDIRAELRRSDSDHLVCQFCSGAMFARQGSFIPHFVHRAKECTNPPINRRERESFEHLLGKKFVRDHLREVYPRHLVRLEVPLMDRTRVADVMVTAPDGWSVAHEIQLSNIPRRVLEERTDDYAREGIDVVWWFGERASPPMREFVIERFQPLYILTFEEVTNAYDEAPAKVAQASHVSPAAGAASTQREAADHEPQP